MDYKNVLFSLATGILCLIVNTNIFGQVTSPQEYERRRAERANEENRKYQMQREQQKRDQEIQKKYISPGYQADPNTPLTMPELQRKRALEKAVETERQKEKDIAAERELHKATKGFDWISGEINANGLRLVRRGEMYGFIDKENVAKIPLIYNDAASNFSSGLVAAKFNNAWGFLNASDNWIIPFMYQYADNFNPYNELARVILNGRWGLIDKKR